MAVTSSDLLQSLAWELFQRALGRKTHRVDGVLAIEMPLPFGGKYLYAPRASPPPCHPEAKPKDLTSSVERIARETGAVFWRAEFSINLTTHDSRLTTPFVLRRAVEPEWTWRTSLAGSDDERMAAMHPKHRYNIRIAERRGVTVRVVPPPHAPPPGEGGKEKSFLPFHGSGGGATCPSKPRGRSGRGGGDVDAFWPLLQDTARRQGIATHPRSYYETMLRELSRKPTATSYKPDSDCRLYLTERESEPLAAAIVAYHGDTATYLHGGSSYEHRALMAPHLLHWQAMRDAKAAGMRWYEFGGIEPPAASRQPQANDRTPRSACSWKLEAGSSGWSGMTRFKMGFGGEAVHHPPTMDLVFRPGWYRMLSLLARLRN